MIIYWSMLLWAPLIYFIYSLGHKEEILLTDYNIQQGIQKNTPRLRNSCVRIFYLLDWNENLHC